jgi:hypothetical protein
VILKICLDKKYNNLYTAGRSVENVQRRWRQCNASHANFSLCVEYNFLSFLKLVEILAKCIKLLCFD